MNKEQNQTNAAEGQSELTAFVMREGYCCDCNNNPDETLALASSIPGNPCNGCWFNDAKPNWKPKGGKQYYTGDGMLMNGDGSRSIFDDIDS